MIYFEIAKFQFLRFLTYPLEILTSVLKRLVDTAFLIVLWSIIIKNTSGLITLPEIVSYFLLASGIEEIVMAHWGFLGDYLGWRIKLGKFSNYLLKPVSIIPQLYASAIGRNGMRVILAIVSIIAGIIIHPPQNSLSVALFLVFFITALFTGLAYNIILGTMYFHFVDASGVKNAISHMSRLLSGAMVPIYLFPENFKNLILLTPFPGMVYGPVNALKTNQLNQEVIVQLFVIIFWMLILNVGAYLFWNQSIKKYEAVGT
ncbi:hypothetical protein A2686_02295 [Candidatus Woesebacteria bacterium RIFCSPHIGHO2_01_FULL_38_10]|uniref:ABC transporter permease n=1 Tax=Candidatus Woesebacteria bacterium RIFCSPLOWO2_01_FULL_39_10b TaxID=1802517 RepID=A0A1F8BBU1_9BACT|nr:MAG: hypothetical protein A2686_02295 [Candidatus Woesebacteria bacterium RIFCSPHIGHO2_01_FULL_38_10]OGM60808.1 MAG: hypothetical protein A2892_02070 [Candidatus Woesebacteria bacterium RIFCSPLOWO2_01_FULL_39_10b]